MNQCQKVIKGTIVITENHWMISYTNKLYFKYLAGYYPNKKFGLVNDFILTHISSEVVKWVGDSNSKPNRGCTFGVVFVNPF